MEFLAEVIADIALAIVPNKWSTVILFFGIMAVIVGGILYFSK